MIFAAVAASILLLGICCVCKRANADRNHSMKSTASIGTFGSGSGRDSVGYRQIYSKDSSLASARLKRISEFDKLQNIGYGGMN